MLAWKCYFIAVNKQTLQEQVLCGMLLGGWQAAILLMKNPFGWQSFTGAEHTHKKKKEKEK